MPQAAMISLYDIIRISSLLLLLPKSDIDAFLSQPQCLQFSTSYSDARSTYRKSFEAWSVTSGPPKLIIDNSRQTHDVASERKLNKQSGQSSRVYSFQRSSATTSTGLWESKLRSSIVTKKWDEASTLLQTLNSTKLPSGRDVVYVITETSRKNQNISAIIPLLSALVKLERGFDYSTENDIMPLLSECSMNNRISAGYRIVTWLYGRNMKFTAKTYSVLLKGYGLQRNEQMIDRVLQDCVKYSVQPDIVLLNGAIDAYVRCDNPQKAIDLFDAVMSDADTNINNDKKSYSNKEKEDILKISRCFINKKLMPNIRTYNTVLKALRGYESFEKCMEVISVMKENDVSPDSVTMNTLIDAAVTSGNLDIAEDLLKHPMAAPGVEAYTAIISGYSREGNVAEAFKILNLMISKNIPPNSYTLTALMKTCVTKGDWERARELLNPGKIYATSSTSQNGVKSPPDTTRLASTMNPYLTPKEMSVLHGSYVIGLCSLAVSSEDVEDREIYLKEAQYELIAMEEKKLKPDTATMNAFIQALCAMQPARVTDALLILRAMKIENIGPDDYTYSILFTALGKEGYIDEALQLFRSTDKFMDTPALNSLLRAFIGGPNPMQAIQIYQEIISSNSSIVEHGQFVPSKYTFTILFLAISRSLAPQKFLSPVDRRPTGFEEMGTSKVRDRRVKPRPLRYLTSARTASENKDAPKDVVVDTTIRNIAPPLQALSMLGEVVKSIGSKLNANTRTPSDAAPYAIKGVYGNYVSNSYEESMERKRVEEEAAIKREKEQSKPLAYDTDSGRFYEVTTDKNTGIRTAGQESLTGTKIAENSVLRKARPSYTSEDIMDSEDSRDYDKQYDKYGPPDNLDLLRTTYFKNQEIKSAKAKMMKNNLLAVKSDGEDTEKPGSTTDLANMNADALLQKLFLSMRFDHNIEADEIMISALNSLFSTTNHFEAPKAVSKDEMVRRDRDKDGGVGDLGAMTNSYNNYKPSTPPSVSLGWARKSGLSKKTAELVFADLVISGWHPRMFQPILYSCGYSQSKVTELLKDDEANNAIKKIRASAASIRIFKKHDWNNVESGWSSFFQ